MRITFITIRVWKIRHLSYVMWDIHTYMIWHLMWNQSYLLHRQRHSMCYCVILKPSCCLCTAHIIPVTHISIQQYLSSIMLLGRKSAENHCSIRHVYKCFSLAAQEVKDAQRKQIIVTNPSSFCAPQSGPETSMGSLGSPEELSRIVSLNL